jgi:hypothetical protein
MTASVHPLSRNQELIWRMQRLMPQSPVYCEAIAWRILSELDAHALQLTCQWLSDRHASLRTTYGIRAGQPVQRVHETQRVPFRIHDARDWDDQEFQAHFDREVFRLFDLEAGPMLRADLFLREPGEHRLLLSCHHIAADFYSLMLVLEDIRAIYPAARRGGAPPPPPTSTYADFVRWQAALLDSPEGDRQWQFWQQQAGGAPEPLRLPADFPRPAATTYEGKTLRFALNGDLTSRLRALARSLSATMNAVLLGGFQTLLHLWCGQTRFGVRTIVSGRSDPAFAYVVGHFANTVSIDAEFSEDLTFADIVARARRSVTAAIEHQDFPLALLAERLQAAGHAAANRWSDVMFRLQIPHRFRTELREQKLPDGVGSSLAGARGTRMDFGGLVAELFNPIHTVAYSSLDLELVEAGGEVTGYLHYRADMFREATIARLAERYVKLLDSAVEHPERCARALDTVPGTARPQTPGRGTGERHAEQAPASVPESFGRMEGQVRCWGLAVNLRDVEAALREHPGVRESVVVALTHDHELSRVVAYVVLRSDALSTGDAELRRHLQPRIPRYLIPAIFVFRDALPRALEGGPARTLLSSPGELGSALDSARDRVRSPTEERVERRWRELFGMDLLSVHDNFFALGGHSLLAAHMSVLISREFDVELPLGILLESPTLAELAAHIDRVLPAGADSQPPSEHPGGRHRKPAT